MIGLPAHAALLLDLDGTLIDIAATPDGVVVPPTLPPALRTLRDRLGGALAIVTGRAVEVVEALLPGVATAIAGEHGGAIRFAPGGPIVRAALPDVPPDWIAVGQRVVAEHPGTLFERKARGFALHYRQAPAAGPALEAAARAMVADRATHLLLPGSMVWEIKPRGADKGTAIAALMRHAPFAGRVPVYVGDDVTDLDGFREARALGGLGVQVQDAFGDAAGVRVWLARLAAAEGDSAPP
jgi:trehalose 6-phosphate phosphatase